MRLSISGTYGSGKTSTVTALSYFTGIPYAPVKAIREILPDAVPGKRLTQVTPAEYLQVAVRRHTHRAVNEARLGAQYLADGSSLQDWIYAAARVEFGMDPGRPGAGPDPDSADMRFFAAVTEQLGHAFKQHVRESFDAFVHLRRPPGPIRPGSGHHRPMNEEFRSYCDDMLLRTLDELKIPCLVVDGPIPGRLEQITDHYELSPVRSLDQALQLARADYASIDWCLEQQRPQGDPAPLATATR
ncbi:AAA family ATPase [Streptomyces sp. NPDC006879]|uniref:AAA family ATPase n=1 Tax=Streptomyces sp. NPDC006879 TaxID=3364767 RepID=UPI0036BC6E5E